MFSTLRGSLIEGCFEEILTGEVIQVAVLSMTLLIVAEQPCQARVQKKTIEDGWRLEQRNSHLGPIEVFISNSGVKVSCKQSKGAVVSSAPDWKVVAYNTDAKLIFDSTYEAFIKNPLPGIVAVSDHFVGKKPVSVVFSGVKALEVKAELKGKSQNMMLHTWSGIEKKYEHPNEVRLITFVATQETLASPKAIDVLRAIYKTPKIGGFPLLVSTRYPKGDIGYSLKTYSLERVKIDPRTCYSYPLKGYTQARTAEVTVLPDVSGLFGVLDEGK